MENESSAWPNLALEDQTLAQGNTSSWNQLNDDDDDLFLVDDELNLNTSSLRSDEKYVGFDNNVGDTWLYPSNFPERAYQYNIVQKALFHNTLVVLPTGLGKTFIAAVVIYNMYRWYPMGKVIFMAPTRPLVAQQIDACCKIMGIPKEDSVEITGKLNKASRAQLWQSKRVFFATPQSVQSDLTDAELTFPFQAVKLVVVDEAHKAKGRYAYTEVVNSIWKKNKFFRVLALSATPGRRAEDVEEVIRNLFISNLEVRTEDSVDVVCYIHKRQIKTVVVELGPKLSAIRDELVAIADPHLRNLIDNRLISGRVGSVSRNWLVMEQKKFRESLQGNKTPLERELSSDFSICISVYHAIELLERHGLRVFLNNFDETQDGGAKFVVILRPDLRRLIQRVREEVGPNPFAFSDQCMVNGEIAPIPSDIDFGHPKFEIARDHVLKHFENNHEARVIIFCEYRESVMLMHRLLLQHRPLIRPKVFVGQGGTGSIRAVTQGQQMKVMNEFRNGETNALIATSVAEEGIDVGEVDLIVCFDINTTNPTRFIQRIGRTGRKKDGKVLLLATEGKEHTVLKEVLSERNRLNKSISRGGGFSSVLYKQAPRMVPTEFNPKCMKTYIQPTVEQSTRPKEKPTKTAKVGQKKDLRHFFKQKVVLDSAEKNVFEELDAPSTSKASESLLRRRTFSDETPAIVERSPPKSTDFNSKVLRKIAKYVKNNTKVQTIDAQKALTSKKFSKDSSEFLLEFSPHLLPNVWERMQSMWQRGIDENHLPLSGLSSEDRQAVRSYFQSMNIFGSKENIATFLENRRQIPTNFYFSNLMKKYDFVFGDIDRRGDSFEYLIEKFNEVSKLVSTDKESTDYAESMVYDDGVDEFEQTTSSHDFSNECVIDSKYMSQWETPAGDDVSFVCESPRVEFRNTATKQISIKDSLLRSNPATPSINRANIANVSYKVTEEKDESDDDDVIFLGVAQQSTPLRTSSAKQTLLNFKETPIASTKGHIQRMPPKKKSQIKSLDFIKIVKSKRSHIETASSHNEPNKQCRQTPEKKPEDVLCDDVNFFDDQFDAIIAANSGILEQIENSTACSQNTAREKPGKADVSNIEKNSTASENVTSGNKSFLDENDSTPDGVASINESIMSDSSITIDEPKAIEYSNKCDLANLDHPELAGIDLLNFSEDFSEEINDTIKTMINPQPPVISQIPSPDIFADLSQHHLESKAREESPKKCSPPPQVSPCLVSKKPLTWREVRLKYGQPSHSEPKPAVTKLQDDSVIQVGSLGRIRPKRRIISSDSDSSDDFHTKRQRNTTSAIQDSQEIPARSLVRKPLLPRKRTHEFIDDEAALSGSATEDELENTIGCYMLDSVVVHDDDVENEMVNMTQVYLQSVRSPSGNQRGAFKIPARRQFNDASRIFSQQVPVDDASYADDSFVVTISDEESDGEHSMCPLERAEQILKEKRRAKRQAKLMTRTELKPPTKKKRILRIRNSSEDDDDFA